MANVFSGSEFSVDTVSEWLPFSAAPLSRKCVAPIGSVISLHFSFNHVIRFVCCFAFPRRLFSFFTNDLSPFTVLMGISAPATLQHMSEVSKVSKVVLFFPYIVQSRFYL